MSFDSLNISERMIADEPDLENVTTHKDGNACMKAAFLYYVSKKSVSSERLDGSYLKLCIFITCLCFEFLGSGQSDD